MFRLLGMERVMKMCSDSLEKSRSCRESVSYTSYAGRSTIARSPCQTRKSDVAEPSRPLLGPIPST
jgi:hypothetical protein